jgi:signal transduction histidine kinase
MSLHGSEGTGGARFAGRESARRRPDRPQGDPSLGDLTSQGRGEKSGHELAAVLERIKDELGFDTASMYVPGPGGWELFQRTGPERAWHGLLDPSALEGTPEAAEYPDVRALPGVGPRLASLGCTSLATLPLPESARLLLDSAAPPRQRAWIERSRPYLALISVMSGPDWPAGGSLRNQEEIAALHRVFASSQEVLGRAGATTEELLAAVRAALGADELALLSERGGDMVALSAPVALRPGTVPKDVQAMIHASTEAGLDAAAIQKLAVALGSASRAVAGAFGRQEDGIEIVLAGWADGPALSAVSMGVVARTVSTARAALEVRRQAISSVIDRERARMAYALHDGLTQTVAGAVLELEALHQRIERDPVEALEVLDHSKTEIRRALAELRSMLFDLSQPPEDEPKPAEPLTRYIEDVVKRWRLPARVAVEGDLGRVPGRVLSVAYVVIREALANAAKHAASRNVTVTLSTNDTYLVVVVGDGGRGFTRQDEEAARGANHYGLDMLRRRVGEIGGELQVESRPGDGTRVVARLPLNEAAR